MYIDSLNLATGQKKCYGLDVIISSLKFYSEMSVKMGMVISTGLKSLRNLQSALEKQK